ncbi:hypothetical protein FOA52_003290 [Chlamydomonas sp. UWO 241]|nr:hypothetical protein FOA52_003290 [Chlamydomonas sp. UWO 241]
MPDADLVTGVGLEPVGITASMAADSVVAQPPPCDDEAPLPQRSEAESASKADAATFSFLQFVRFCGSGLLMSVSYLDPGNLEADIQVGVQAGYTLLWWFLLCAVLFGFVVQSLAGQLGIVTGADLAQHCGKRYPKYARWLLWILIEIAIVGADIQETIGSAIAISILTSGTVPLWAGCIIVSVTAFMLLLLQGFGYRQLELVFGLFIALEAAALATNFFQAGVPAKSIFLGMVYPRLSGATVPVAVGALGALVMPYNVFFQSSIVLSRSHAKGLLAGLNPKEESPSAPSDTGPDETSGSGSGEGLNGGPDGGPKERLDGESNQGLARGTADANGSDARVAGPEQGAVCAGAEAVAVAAPETGSDSGSGCEAVGTRLRRWWKTGRSGSGGEEVEAAVRRGAMVATVHDALVATPRGALAAKPDESNSPGMLAVLRRTLMFGGGSSSSDSFDEAEKPLTPTRLLLTYMRIENAVVLFVAFVINLFVVCVFAKAFYDPAADPPVEIGLQSAGDFLAEEFGDSFRTIWAVGLFASGQVATISLTYAGQLVMAGLLGIVVQAGPRMLATRCVALVPTVVLAVAFESTNTFDKVAQTLNVVQALVLPFALLPVIHMTANASVMGGGVAKSGLGRCGRGWTIASGAIAAAVTGVNMYLLATLLGEAAVGPPGGSWAMVTIAVVGIYFSLVAYYAIGPDNVPAVIARTRKDARMVATWVRSKIPLRRLDPETMLEVHW